MCDINTAIGKNSFTCLMMLWMETKSFLTIKTLFLDSCQIWFLQKIFHPFCLKTGIFFTEGVLRKICIASLCYVWKCPRGHIYANQIELHHCYRFVDKSTKQIFKLIVGKFCFLFTAVWYVQNVSRVSKVIYNTVTKNLMYQKRLHSLSFSRLLRTFNSISWFYFFFFFPPFFPFFPFLSPSSSPAAALARFLPSGVLAYQVCKIKEHV